MARRELTEIIAYIARDNPDAAQTLRDEIVRKVRLLPQRPHLYRSGRLPGTREMIVRKSYVVVYMENPDAVTVLRVLHTAMLWP